MARPRPDAAGDADFEFEAESDENDQVFLADDDGEDDETASICSDDSGYERWLATQASPTGLLRGVDQTKSATSNCSAKPSFPKAAEAEDRAESVATLLEEKDLLEQALLRAESSIQEKVLEIELLLEANDLLTEQVCAKESECCDTADTVRLKSEEQDELLQEFQTKVADAIARAVKAELECENLAKSLEDKESERMTFAERADHEKELLNEELQQKIEEVELLKKTFESSKQNLSMQLRDHNTLLDALREQLTAEKGLVDEELRQKTEEVKLLSEKFSAEKAALVAIHQQQVSQAQAEQFEVNALLEVKDTEIKTLLERQTSMDQEMGKFEKQKAETKAEVENAWAAHDESNKDHRKLHADLRDLFELMKAKPSDDIRVPGSFPEETPQSSSHRSDGLNWKWPKAAAESGELNVNDMLAMMTKRLLYLLDREDLCGVLEKELSDRRDYASLADMELQQLKDEFQHFRTNADSLRNDLCNQNLQTESELQDLQDMISQIVAESETEKMALREEKDNIANRLKQFEAQYARLTNERADLGRESDKRMDKLRKENQSVQEEVRKAGLSQSELSKKYEREMNKLRQKMQQEDRSAGLQQAELTEKYDRAQKESDRVNKQLHDELDKKDAEIKTLKQQQGYGYASTSSVRRTGKGICQICFKPECPLGDSFSYYA